MNFATDLASVSHGIQLAIAPVFLLTAVAGMMGAVAGRLARIIDRARFLQDRLDAGGLDTPAKAKIYDELYRLRHRGWLVNGSLGFLTFCALLIGLTIILLFLGETSALPSFHIATVCFVGGVVCFLLALVCFLIETVLSMHKLKFEQWPTR